MKWGEWQEETTLRDIGRALEAYAPGERLGLAFACWLFTPAPDGGQRRIPGDIGRLVDVLRRWKGEQAAGPA